MPEIKMETNLSRVGVSVVGPLKQLFLSNLGVQSSGLGEKGGSKYSNPAPSVDPTNTLSSSLQMALTPCERLTLLGLSHPC